MINDKIKPSLNNFLQRLHPIVSRDICSFAEQEVRLPKGPRKGLMYDSSFAPFNKFIFDAIMNPYWRKIAILGPTQNGKTTIATNIPLLYFLFEKQEDVIFGIPTMDMAAGMWLEKLKPVIEDSKYADMLPTTGAGSKGGSFTAVIFKNGCSLRFMAAGGGAENKSSFTAPNVLLTEVDKMDDAMGDGSEADPVSLIQQRADSFEDSNIIMECTVTDESGRIWQEAMVQGTGSEIFVACPMCHGWQTLERDGLVFDPTSQVSAEETARYKCNICGELWSNNDRLEALQSPKLVHKGQSINEDGDIIGDCPPTKTFGLRYNVLHSPMQSLAKTAGQQWEADTSDLKEKKKAMVQSKWALPWTDEDAIRDKLTKTILRNKANECRYPLGVVPEWADTICMGVDVQKGYCFYQVEAYNLTTMKSMVVEYGTVDQRQDSDAGIINMLTEVDDIAKEGWVKEEGGTIGADIRLVDCGFRYDVIQKWLLSNRNWYGLKGDSRKERAKVSGKKEVYRIDGIMTIRPQDNGQNLWFIEVDNTKALVHDRYILDSESIEGYRYVPQDVDIVWINHMTAEERVYDPLGESFEWVKKARRNDYLDIASYNVAGAYFLRDRGKRKVERERQIEKANNDALNREGQSSRIAPRQQRTMGGSWFSDRGAKLQY